MTNQDLEISSVEVLDEAASIVRDVQEDIEIEYRLDKDFELTEVIRAEQELINLVDRIRNTDQEIAVALNCSSFPLVTGEIRFTSDNFLVLRQSTGNSLINLQHVAYVVGADQRAIFRNLNADIDTTTMWLKNLMDEFSLVTTFLINGNQLAGQLIRFNHDHLDLQIKDQRYLIPLNSVVLIRSTDETKF